MSRIKLRPELKRFFPFSVFLDDGYDQYGQTFYYRTKKKTALLSHIMSGQVTKE
jgi:hypothetical protein